MPLGKGTAGVTSPWDRVSARGEHFPRSSPEVATTDGLCALASAAVGRRTRPMVMTVG